MNVVYFKIIRTVRSRYGFTERVEEERRRCTNEELDGVVAQFRSRYEVIEVRVVKT
jgi:hypothetical protein